MFSAVPPVVSIPQTSVTTSTVGFGTSGIMGSSLTDRGRLRLLDCALDAGITHFDTAPLYGMGDAESLVGKFLARHRGRTTVATKYGLSPPRLSRWHKLAAPVARAVYHRSTRLKGLIDAVVSRSTPPEGKAPESSGVVIEAPAQEPAAYLCADIVKSVHNSLRELGIECIDIFLLHDCVPANVSEDVLSCLHDLRDQGKLRAYGLATGKQSTADILCQLPDFRGVVQVPLTVMDDGLKDVQLANNLLTITHSALNRAVSRLQEHLNVRDSRRRWSDAIGIDLSLPASIPTMLLAHARFSNPDGIVLFSSRNPENIRQSVRALCELGISNEQLSVFVTLAHRELQAG